MASETSPVWFITGCSTGFGHELAKLVLARGFRAVVTARDKARVAALAKSGGDRALALDLEMTDQAQIAAAAQVAEKHFGQVDVLVNNAGYGYQAPIEEGEDAEIRAQFEANVFGLFALTRAVLPGMRKRRTGHIINITSVAGFIGYPGSGYYAASKHAVEGFSDSLAAEVKGPTTDQGRMSPAAGPTDAGLPLRFAGVSKSYGTATALHPTDLTIEAGEFLTLLGPSGSGKTTLLNLIAGYLNPDAGRLFIGDRDVTHLPARQRNIGMVFQNYALFPHMTVAENVAYGLVVRRRPRAEIKARVDAALATVELTGYGDRAIQQLSGGQQQRVALARALVIEPDVLLMDEPLGALDRQLRRNVQLELRRLHEERRRTTLYVTHDQEEALILSDRVAVMRAGRIEQLGPVADLYNNPVNSFVASFIGESNLLPARLVARHEASLQVEIPALRQNLTLPLLATSAALASDMTLLLLIRPEHLLLDESGPLTALVEEVVYLGELTALRLRLESGADLWLRRLTDRKITRGMTLRVNWQPAHLRLLPKT